MHTASAISAPVISVCSSARRYRSASAPSVAARRAAIFAPFRWRRMPFPVSLTFVPETSTPSG
ncbi:MAG TPA: hypothetical protein DD433_02405 [Ruminococcaceae bacterium]|nr:hypothetical protein [Oscillospiraceae bacterium]